MGSGAAPDFGICPCGGRYENRSVEVRMSVGGEVVVLADVAQGACPVCGGHVYKADVLERIETVLKLGQ
jgi:YgiT-type zinc finger domain-containing protein